MKELLFTRISAVWLLLVLATLVSFESSTQFIANIHFASTIVLIVAGIKVRMVGLEFMELRQAPISVRIGFEVWVVTVFAAIIVLYWQAPTNL